MSRTQSPHPLWPCLKVSQWPAADQQAWARALQPPHPLEPTIGYAGRWRPITIQRIAEDYGRWLGWLRNQRNLEPLSTPDSRVTKNSIRQYLDAMQGAGLSDYSVSGRLQRLGNALKALDPLADWQWIARAAARLHSEAQPRRNVDECMQPPEVVLQLADDLMTEADHGRFRLPVERAALYRDGLMIGLQVLRALRLKNLGEILVGKHLVERDTHWRLEFSPDEMKAKQAFACSWPETLEDPLRRYLGHYRPLLMTGGARTRRAIHELWVGQGGVAMGEDAIAYRFRIRTTEEFGRPIHTHAFRHTASTTMADDDPDGATAFSAALAHSGPATSEKYYNRAKAVRAVDRFQDEVLSIRRPTGRRKSRPPAGMDQLI